MLDPHLFEDVHAAFRRLMADRLERRRFLAFSAIIMTLGVIILAAQALA